MVTITDISDRCFTLTEKYRLTSEHTKDLVGLALLVIQHCQDRIAVPEASVTVAPYEKP